MLGWALTVFLVLSVSCALSCINSIRPSTVSCHSSIAPANLASGIFLLNVHFSSFKDAASAAWVQNLNTVICVSLGSYGNKHTQQIEPCGFNFFRARFMSSSNSRSCCSSRCSSFIVISCESRKRWIALVGDVDGGLRLDVLPGISGCWWIMLCCRWLSPRICREIKVANV